jgi:hypothetical protein
VSGSDGRVDFQLHEPLPETIYISLSEDDLSCGRPMEVKLQELLTKGVSAAGCQLCDLASQLSARPGEAILFARRPPWWYRLLAPLERE